MRRLKILLLDDREIIRESLTRLLDEQDTIDVVSQCSGIKQTLDEVKRTKPDIVLIDGNLVECESYEAARKISQTIPGVKVAVLTDSTDQDELISIIESGATGYLLTETKVDDFIESIDLIGKGGFVISPKVAKTLCDSLNGISFETEHGQNGLSRREVEITKLLALGSTNKMIATALFIAENTVKVHVKNILHKLELHNRQQIAAYAVQHRLITDIGNSDKH